MFQSPVLYRRSMLLLAGLLALCLGCASTRPADTQVSDGWINSKVKSKIASDPEVNPFEIDVDTTDGVVRLSGTVEGEQARNEAERLARATKGVRSVINEIQLGDPSAGEVFNDAWIVTKIKSKLTADPQINPFNIDVDAVRGVVTLSGTVAKQVARDEAGRHARETRGVKQVHNRITVKSK